ncbi:MAG: GNAT family N-acetyltransferase [Bacteroidetes bacterium]|nr:GNAT family N-acetyltransferase [Bacteroidota bacterium]
MEISITPITNRDIEGVLKLWNKVLPLDAVTLDSLEARVLLDENFDENTFVIAKEGDLIVGFVVGTYARRVPLGDHDPKGDRCWITALGVEPERQKQGIASRMLSSLFEKFKTLGKRECYIATYAPGYFVPGIDIKEYSDAISFLKKSGFEETYRPLSMDTQLPLFKVTREAEEKEKRLQENGILIRPYMRNDLLSFLKFLEASMPSDWVRVSRANLRDLTRGIFQTDQIFIAVSDRDNDVIGYCQFEGAHFGPFGVADKYQGKGIGTVLLGRTLERMRAKGYHNAYVLWTDDVAAKVYSKFGFKETRRFVVMRKSIV